MKENNNTVLYVQLVAGVIFGALAGTTLAQGRKVGWIYVECASVFLISALVDAIKLIKKRNKM